jgi:hypothetical protein
LPVALPQWTARRPWFEVASGSAWTGARDELAGGLAAADGHPAELEMRALRQPHLRLEPGVVGPEVDREQLGPRALADVSRMRCSSGPLAVEHHALARASRRRERDVLPHAEVLGRERASTAKSA